MLFIQEVCKTFPSLLGNEIQMQGRVLTVRQMKKSIFIDLFSKDARIQCHFDLSTNFIPHSGDLIEVYGKCAYSNRGEPTVYVSQATVITKWNADIDYKKVSEGRSGPLFAFLPEARRRFHFSQAIRNHMRQFLVSESYFEVQTPILGRNYNGGRSFPVESLCLKKKIGFNRTTMEDRMQSLVAMGYERVFQIGSIFRSNKELTFIEGYETYTDWETGKQRIQNLLAYVIRKLLEEGVGEINDALERIVNKIWLEVNFLEGVYSLTGLTSEEVLAKGSNLIDSLFREGIIKNKNIAPENIADELANAIAEKTGVPTIVNGFPIWSSPLYAVSKENESCLMRSRLYIPELKGGLEIGIQENNHNNFVKRVGKQRREWGLLKRDNHEKESDLATVISGGLPPIFGFGLNPDRIVRIWHPDCSIDPYLE